jgi:hypothetical protein
MNRNSNHDITEELTDVRGGAGAAPAPVPQLQAPIKYPQLAPPKPFTPPQGMAPPKYSAGWWDLVRARGLAK